MTQGYAEHKEWLRRYAAQKSAEGRDVAPFPPVENPARAKRSARDLGRFMREYFPDAFYLPFSPAHLRVVAAMERAILQGGKFAVAMPRGSGKTTMAMAAIVWALCHGHRRFVVLVAATDWAAAKILHNVVTMLASNPLLAADYPALCHPLRRLENVKHRMAGQTYEGAPTLMQWSKSEFTAATIPGAASSGCALVAAGVTGAIRGLSRARPDGQIVRPDLILVDDFQTAESAKSAEQCRDRLAILNGDVLELGGPDKQVACVCTATVIAPGDAADQLFDREKFPAWDSERVKLLPKFPSDLKLWEEYWDVYCEALRTAHDVEPATRFYLAHREEMDAGAEVSWPERFRPGEASGLQYAMDLYFEKPEAFAAEYQNEPRQAAAAEREQLTAETLTAKMARGVPQGTAPAGTTALTLFVDVQLRMLFWMVVGFAETGSSHVVDYGAWPKQKNRLFKASDKGATLADAYPGLGEQAARLAGVRDLTTALFRREFPREDGATLRLSRGLVDAGFDPETVRAATRDNDFAAALLPSVGRPIGPAQKPIDEWKRGVGDKIGHNWYVRRGAGTRAGRFVGYDANWWKSYVRRALMAAPGEPGGLTLPGGKPWKHELLFQHLTSERYEPTAGRGRVVEVWTALPHAENHWWDCLVGCHVAASWGGILPGGAAPRAASPPAAPAAPPGEGRASARPVERELDPPSSPASGPAPGRIAPRGRIVPRR